MGRIENGKDGGMIVAERRFARQPSDRTPSGKDVHLARAIVSAKAGSRDALSYIYCRYADAVYRHVRGVVGDEHEAEDITQSVFAKLTTTIGRYEARSVPFSAWLFRVARNAALDHLRHARCVPVPEVRENGAAGTTNAPGPSKADSLLDALGELTDDQRAVVVLRHFAGLTPPEIATRIGVTEASVHGLHHRGRHTLQRALAARGVAPTVRDVGAAANAPA